MYLAFAFAPRFLRPLGALAAGLALVLQAPAAGAQDYPSRVVTMVVPFGPGNAYDVMARYVADRLGEKLGQTVIVEPRQGAVGNVAAAHVARSAPDGHTIFFGANSTHAANVHLFRQLPYDPVKDFAPITTIATIPQVLLVSPSVGVDTLQGLIEKARKEPGKLNYGASSATGRVASESFRRKAGIEAAFVPYKTTTQAITDLISGQLHFMIADAGAGIAQARTGRVKALAVTSARRLSAAQDLPTMAEAGLEGFEFTAWLALFAPAKTPPAIVQRLAKLTDEVVRSDRFRETLDRLYAQPFPGTPESLRELAARDTVRWGEMVKAAGIEPM